MDRYDALFVAGLGLTSWGLFLFWPPAAAIFPGLVLMGLGIHGARAHRE